MINDQAFVLVVGSADTGRSPLVAALLRRALPDIHIRSAGVLSHDGEPADNEARMALEQLGLQLGEHHARSLDANEVRQADLLLAVDRGIERVLQARFTTATPLAALSDLSGINDVIDTHRMPLGLWIAAARTFEAQINASLPSLREHLGAQGSKHAPQPLAIAPPGDALSARAAPLSRINRLLETAQLLPEIVDWSRLRTEVSDRLREIADLGQGPADLTRAATLMLDGLLAQAVTTPTAIQLEHIRNMVKRLEYPIDGAMLALLGGEIARWNAG